MRYIMDKNKLAVVRRLTQGSKQNFSGSNKTLIADQR